MINVDKELEIKLLEYIKDKYLPDRFRKSVSTYEFKQKDFSFFAKAAADLSESFTKGRNKMPKNYFNKKEFRSAYLLYFMLTNYVKTMKCLDEAFTNCPPAKNEMNILDLGCGPATSSIASSYFFSANFPNVSLSIVGIDQNKEILNDAENLFRLFGKKNHEFKTYISDVKRGRFTNLLRQKNMRFDIIIAANILNEIGDVNDQSFLISSLSKDHLNDKGVIIIIDPAPRVTARQLMELRNLIIAEIPHLKVFHPCTHQSFCPMLLKNRRDWCHFYLEWNCPESIRNVDRLVGIKHDYLKMAYLIFKKTVFSDDSKLWRVVSSPLKSKGKVEIIICGEDKLRKIVCLDKDRSEKNNVIDRIKRGDLISIETNNDRLKSDDIIVIKRPFNYFTFHPSTSQ